MELVIKFYSAIVLFLFLSSCASTDVEEAAFESTEEESRRILDDAYVVEQQKKLKDYQPDKVNFKTIPMHSTNLKAPNFKGTSSQRVKSKAVTSDKSFLSQTPTWKDQDLKSFDLWQLFSNKFLKESEKHIFSASYTGINAATLVIEVKPSVRYQSRDVFHFQARAQTADFYKWVYSLNDVVDSLVDKQHFVSLKYSLIQKEKK